MISLRRKLLGCFLLGGGIALLLQLLLQRESLVSLAREFEQEVYQAVASEVREEIARSGGGDAGAQLVLAELERRNPVFDAYLLDEDGKVLLSPGHVAAEGSIPRSFLSEQLEVTHRLTSVCGRDPRNVLPCPAFSLARYSEQGKVRFVYLVVARDVSEVFLGWAGIHRLLHHLGWGSFFSLIVLTAIALVLSAYLLRELQLLLGVLSRFSAGEFSARYRPRGNDDISLLGESLNRMARAVLQRREDLLTSTEERRRWVQSLLHDLRRPLAARKLQLESWLQSLDSPSSEEGRIPQSKVQSSLESEALLLSRLHGDRADAPGGVPKPYSLNAVLGRVVTDLDGVAGERKLQVICDLQEGLPPAFGLESEIYRVALNLVDNALRYSPPNGQVRLRSFLENDLPHFEVEDQGIGFSSEERERIFDFSYRGTAARAVNPQGTGLGLMIVRRLIVAEGGALRIENAQGGGAKFTAVLPSEGNRIAFLEEANLPPESRQSIREESAPLPRNRLWSIAEFVSLLSSLSLLFIFSGHASLQFLQLCVFGGSVITCALLSQPQLRPLTAIVVILLWALFPCVLLFFPLSEASCLSFAFIPLVLGVFLVDGREKSERRIAGFSLVLASIAVVVRGKPLELGIYGFVFGASLLFAQQFNVVNFRSLHTRVRLSVYAIACLVVNAQVYLMSLHFADLLDLGRGLGPGSLKEVVAELHEDVQRLDRGLDSSEVLQNRLASIGATLPRSEFRSYRYDGVLNAASMDYGIVPEIWTPPVVLEILRQFDSGSTGISEWIREGRRYQVEHISLGDGEEILAVASESAFSRFILQRLGQKTVTRTLLLGWLLALVPVLLVEWGMLRGIRRRLREIGNLARGIEQKEEFAPFEDGSRDEITLLEQGIRRLSQEISTARRSLERESANVQSLFSSLGQRLSELRQNQLLLLQTTAESNGELPTLLLRLRREGEAEVELLDDVALSFRESENECLPERHSVREIVYAVLLDVGIRDPEGSAPTLEFLGDEEISSSLSERLLLRIFADTLSLCRETGTEGEAKILLSVENSSVRVSWKRSRLESVPVEDDRLCFARQLLERSGGGLAASPEGDLLLSFSAQGATQEAFGS